MKLTWLNPGKILVTLSLVWRQVTKNIPRLPMLKYWFLYASTLVRNNQEYEY